MEGDYPAKYVWIRDVTGCLCPPRIKRAMLLSYCRYVRAADSINLDEFIFYFNLFLFE